MRCRCSNRPGRRRTGPLPQASPLFRFAKSLIFYAANTLRRLRTVRVLAGANVSTNYELQTTLASTSYVLAEVASVPVGLGSTGFLFAGARPDASVASQ